MSHAVKSEGHISCGDISGRGQVYDSSGRLILEPGESILGISKGFDLTAYTPWRRLAPRVIFLGFNKPAESRLYVTSSRVVLIREIDSWRQVSGEMTPLGIPNAVASKSELDRLRAQGVRQFCEIRPQSLKLIHVRRSSKPGAWIRMRLLGSNGNRYALSIWKTDGEDRDVFSLIESQFPT